MRYINTSYKVSERVFCPYKLFTKKGLEYVVGFCRLRAAIRFFRVDRIKRLTELDKTFQIEPDFNPDEYGETVAFRLRRPYTARIRFEKSLQSKLLTKWEQEEENIYRVPFFNSKDLISELISQPCDFLILSPDWLRQRFIERLKKLCSSNMQV
jgi:predicted DNA-binding transcriptional regulator YafY